MVKSEPVDVAENSLFPDAVRQRLDQQMQRVIDWKSEQIRRQQEQQQRDQQQGQQQRDQQQGQQQGQQGGKKSRSKKRGRKSVHRRNKSMHKKRKSKKNWKHLQFRCESNTNNARIPWRDCRNGRIIRIYIRYSGLLYQQQPTVPKSNAESKTSSRSQQTKVNQECMFMLSMHYFWLFYRLGLGSYGFLFLVLRSPPYALNATNPCDSATDKCNRSIPGGVGAS